VPITVFQKLLVHLFGRLRIEGQGILEALLDLFGDMGPYGTVPHRFQVLGHIIDHAVAELSHGAPVFGIEGFFVHRAVPRIIDCRFFAM
jgi:hypothetical protein